MPSNLTADDFQAVEDRLQKDYFLIHRQTVWLIVAILAAFGVTTVVTAYNAAKAVSIAEAEKIAKAAVTDTAAKAAADEIGKLKTKAEDEKQAITKLKVDAERELAQIRLKREESVTVVSNLAPEFTTLRGRIDEIQRKVGDLLAWVDGPVNLKLFNNPPLSVRSFIGYLSQHVVGTGGNFETLEWVPKRRE